MHLLWVMVLAPGCSSETCDLSTISGFVDLGPEEYLEGTAYLRYEDGDPGYRDEAPIDTDGTFRFGGVLSGTVGIFAVGVVASPPAFNCDTTVESVDVPCDAEIDVVLDEPASCETG